MSIDPKGWGERNILWEKHRSVAFLTCPVEGPNLRPFGVWDHAPTWLPGQRWNLFLMTIQQRQGKETKEKNAPNKMSTNPKGIKFLWAVYHPPPHPKALVTNKRAMRSPPCDKKFFQCSSKLWVAHIPGNLHQVKEGSPEGKNLTQQQTPRAAATRQHLDNHSQSHCLLWGGSPSNPK